MGALSGEQSSEAGPDRRLRGVVPYSLSLVCDRSGIGEPSCEMAWQAFRGVGVGFDEPSTHILVRGIGFP